MEGLPGAGKSFALTRMCIDVLTQQRRPVYTNHPLKLAVFRQFMRLKHGEQYANLVFELTYDHWCRFLKRQSDLASFRAGYRDQCAIDGRRYSDSAADRLFVEDHGPHVSRPGPGRVANWVEPWAFIIIDEAQMWHPAVAVGGKRDKDDAELQDHFKSYLTHHRHHHHDLIFATQSFENLNHTLRRIYRTRWVVRNMAQLKLVGGLKLADLGLRFIGYGAWPKEVYESHRGAGLPPDPIYSRNLWPQLPWYQVYFRLYRSFTHGGSSLDQNRRLKELQIEAGVDDESIAARINQQEREPMYRVLRRFTIKCMITAMWLVVGVGVGAQYFNDPEAETAEAVGELGQTGESALATTEERISAFGLDRVIIGASSVSVGQKYNGATLRLVDMRERLSVWSDPFGIWLWRAGSEPPESLATADDLRDLRERVDELRPSGSSPQSDPSAGGG